MIVAGMQWNRRNPGAGGSINVAIYARHSPASQSRSTGDQVARCRSFCEEAGYRVTREFRDEGLSGAATVDRPGIRDLIEASLDGGFERVLAEDLSRISRDQGDIAHFFKRMAFLDIAVETVVEGEIDELHIGLKGTMNALFLRDLADKTHRGVLAAVLSGGIPGGEIYGYDVVHRQDVRGKPIRGLRRINEDEAAVVREIFKRYTAGQSARGICRQLNRREIPSPRGVRWQATTITGQVAPQTGILRQTLYNGVVTYNRRQYRKHPESGRRVPVPRSEEEWILVPAPELAILEEAVFERAQAALAARSRRHGERRGLQKVLTPEEIAAKTADYERERQSRKNEEKGRFLPLVTGKLVCVHHGELMRTIRRRLYNCPVKGCPNRNLRLERDLMPLVLRDLHRFDGSRVLSGMDRFEGKREELEVRSRDLKRQLEGERSEIANVLDALGRKAALKCVVDWLQERESRVRRLAYDLARAGDEVDRLAPLTPAAVVEIERAFRAELARTVVRDAEGRLVMTGTRTIRPWIESIRVTAAWDDRGARWARSVEILYDVQLLLQALRPLPGKRRRSR